jgi:hypothetical protein
MKKITFLFSCLAFALTAAVVFEAYGEMQGPVNTTQTQDVNAANLLSFWFDINGFEAADFVRIADAGIDNPQNNYAFSSAKFEGAVYVGTGRNFLFRIVDVFRQVGILPPDYQYQFITHPDGDPWSQELATDMGAEIWCYREGVWQKVYKSNPVDVSWVGWPGAPPTNAWAAKEPGFRSMTTFTDKWGEEAVYAASAASLVPGRLLLKSANGTTWEDVATFPTIFESDSRTIAVHNGKLYVGPAGLGTAKLWATDDPMTTGNGSNWQLMADFTTEGPGTNVAVVSLVSWRGYMYAGTQNDDGGFQLWRSNARSPEDPKPGEWTRIIESGAGDLANTRALTMTTFKDALWVGTSMFPLSTEDPFILLPKGFELIRVGADDTWHLIIGNYFAQKPVGGVSTLRLPLSGWPGGFANFLNIYCWSLQEMDGVLYLGTFDMSSFLYVLLEDLITQETAGQVPGTAETANSESIVRLQSWRNLLVDYAGADLWKSRNGIWWEPVTLNGFNNPKHYGYRTMLPFLNSFYVGTANPFGGLEIFRAVNDNGL